MELCDGRFTKGPCQGLGLPDQLMVRGGDMWGLGISSLPSALPFLSCLSGSALPLSVPGEVDRKIQTRWWSQPWEGPSSPRCPGLRQVQAGPACSEGREAPPGGARSSGAGGGERARPHRGPRNSRGRLHSRRSGTAFRDCSLTDGKQTPEGKETVCSHEASSRAEKSHPRAYAATPQLCGHIYKMGIIIG